MKTFGRAIPDVIPHPAWSHVDPSKEGSPCGAPVRLLRTAVEFKDGHLEMIENWECDACGNCITIVVGARFLEEIPVAEGS